MSATRVIGPIIFYFSPEIHIKTLHTF